MKNVAVGGTKSRSRIPWELFDGSCVLSMSPPFLALSELDLGERLFLDYVWQRRQEIETPSVLASHLNISAKSILVMAKKLARLGYLRLEIVDSEGVKEIKVLPGPAFYECQDSCKRGAL